MASVPSPGARRAVALAAAALLLAGAYLVLAPFLGAIAWAAILVYVTWPVHRRVRRAVGERLAAAVTTALVILAVAVPLTLLSLALVDDVAAALRWLRAALSEPPALPGWVADLPVVGGWLAGWHATLRANPGALERLLLARAAGWSQALLEAAGDAGRNAGRLVLALLTAYAFFRHGETLVADLRRALERFTGAGAGPRLELVGATVRGVCYGVVLTALAQGVLATLGFWATGVRAPVLLGVLTALLAFVPFGPPLVWAPAGLWLLTQGAVVRGVALLAWGAVAVSGVDNVLRPYFIGGAARIPFLLVLLGVLGGMAAFGLLGLFVGPALLAVLLAVWRDWAGADSADAPGAGAPGRGAPPAPHDV
jgi:predicted PurR-regulated permease PerM